MANLEIVNNNNMRFMAYEKEIISNSDNLTLEELANAYCDLKKDYKLLNTKYSSLEKEYACCKSKIEELLKLKDEYIAKLDSYKSALEKLKKREWFTQSENE